MFNGSFHCLPPPIADVWGQTTTRPIWPGAQLAQQVGLHLLTTCRLKVCYNIICFYFDPPVLQHLASLNVNSVWITTYVTGNVGMQSDVCSFCINAIYYVTVACQKVIMLLLLIVMLHDDG